MTQDPDADGVDITGAVALAYVHSTRVSYSWHHSIVEMLGYDFATSGRIARGGFVSIRCGTDGLPGARNKAVAQFLADSPAEWLFWVDTDMGFPADTVDQLLAVADPQDRPVVGALAFTQREYEVDGLGGWRTQATPTVMDWQEQDGKRGFTVRFDYPMNTVTRVSGTGSACILAHRSVLQRVADELGPVWYNRIPNESLGELTSEDLSFCMRLGALGVPVHVHTGVVTTHHKELWIGQDDYLRQRALDAAIEEQMTAKAGVSS